MRHSVSFRSTVNIRALFEAKIIYLIDEIANVEKMPNYLSDSSQIQGLIGHLQSLNRLIESENDYVRQMFEECHNDIWDDLEQSTHIYSQFNKFNSKCHELKALTKKKEEHYQNHIEILVMLDHFENNIEEFRNKLDCFDVDDPDELKYHNVNDEINDYDRQAKKLREFFFKKTSDQNIRLTDVQENTKEILKRWTEIKSEKARKDEIHARMLSQSLSILNKSKKKSIWQKIFGN